MYKPTESDSRICLVLTLYLSFNLNLLSKQTKCISMLEEFFEIKKMWVLDKNCHQHKQNALLLQNDCVFKTVPNSM